MDKKQDSRNESINIEINLLVEAIRAKFGYDFRNYSRAHIKRRILHHLGLSGLDSISEMQGKVLHDEGFIQDLLNDLSITVTEMFRDPDFYIALRKEVLPALRTWPFFRIWHAGCSTGEEVYSMAILLKEEGLYDRAQIYATDFNRRALQTAKEGIYPAEHIREYSSNYQKAKGKSDLSDYYNSSYNSVIMNNALKKNIVFAEHNLVTDGDFTEANLIICRNVLIYFDRQLQYKTHNLFLNSLVPGGYLCLGSKETLQFSDAFPYFTVVDESQKIYHKKYILPSQPGYDEV